MLTLFLMLGTAYLVAASRARESANAIARKTLFNDQTNYRPETYLDNVIMQVVRGGGAVSELTEDRNGNGVLDFGEDNDGDTAIDAGQPPTFESLLHDRYDSGNTLTGTVAIPHPIPHEVLPPQLHSAATSPVLVTSADPNGPVINPDCNLAVHSTNHPHSSCSSEWPYSHACSRRKAVH